ncbi:MAG TPA: hypothetical protein VK612_12110 [Pyrinomonadaceae bacterium]|nr:hypothetical protein [Pyrinomonadaceae bacterium]
MNNNSGTQQSVESTENTLINGGDNRETSSFAGTEPYTDRIADKLSSVKIKVSDNLQGAAEKVHEKSDVAQDYLLEKSDKVNTFAHQTIEKANQLGHKAAEAIDASSGYVRDFDIAEKREQVLGAIKERPELSLAVAGISGLLIGLLIGRATRR